ncbi:hypothetical protein DQ04_16201010 [Trypanosoma grayi]|uniref:hypothetical protein n=1 Tax=Trypanosoma grayi TaxID=71804 RepID=UPI0004F45CD9|nr:hypothetical protein DQ04_16201010 [Trypanosoma grayi]KEG06059.1 hypothetical protein DQ04_16201010 [Trypanosoma grayi]
MPRRGWRDIVGVAKRALTSSARSRWNSMDIVDTQKYAWARRRRFQQTNDLFHSAGKRGRTLSFEAITLQFNEVEWSFIVFPAFLALLVILLIAAVGNDGRKTRRQQEMQALQQRADYLASVRESRCASVVAADGE